MPDTTLDTDNPVVDYISQKYYNGGEKDNLYKKFTTDQASLEKAIAETHIKNHKPDQTLGEFESEYYAKYGNPFAEKKKSTPSTESQNLVQPIQNQTQEEVIPTLEESQASYKPSGDGSIVQPLEENKAKEQSPLESFVNTVDRRILDLPAALQEGIGLLGRKLDEGIKEANPALASYNKDHPITDWMLGSAKQYRTWLDEIGVKEGDPRHPLTNSVASAVADLATMVATGGIANEAKAIAVLGEASTNAAIVARTTGTIAKHMTSPVAIVAGTKIASDEYNQAIASGATEDQATDVALQNWAVSGGLEAIPVAQFFKRLDKVTGGGFKNWLKTTAKTGAVQGSEEAITEIMQQAYSNHTAAESYDVTRNILDGMKESGGIGFGMGFVLGAMGVSLRRRQSATQNVNEKAELQKTIDLVDQKTADLESGKLTDQGKTVSVKGQEVTPQQDIPVTEQVQQEAISQTQPTSEAITEESIPSEQITETNDNQSEQQPISSEVGIGEESVQAEPIIEPSQEETSSSGVLQTQESGSESTIKQQPIKERPTKITIGDNNYQVKVQDGEFKIRNKDSKKVISPNSAQGKKIIEEYKTKKIHKLSEGKTADIKENMSNEDYAQSVLYSSENPAEIAHVWSQQEEIPIDAKEQVIKESLRRSPIESIYRFGDRNSVPKIAVLNYTSKKGLSLDVQAMEMANSSGLDITPQDLVDFIGKYPKGKRTATTTNPIKPQLEDKFKSLTGLELTPEFANDIAEFNNIYQKQKEHKYENKFVSTQQLIDELASGEDVSHYEFLFESPEDFKKTIRYAKQQVQAKQKIGQSTSAQTISEERTSDTGITEESQEMGQGTKPEGKGGGDIGPLRDKIRSLRNLESDSEKERVAKEIIKEVDGQLLNREGLLVDNNGSFALPNSKLFFDLLDAKKSVYLLKPNAKVANDIFDYQIIANQLPDVQKSELMQLMEDAEGDAIIFDDAFRLGMIEAAQKEGYDGLLLKEIDGTDSTIHILNPEAITLIHGEEMVKQPIPEPINTQSDPKITIEANKKKGKEQQASLADFGGITVISELLNININDISKKLKKTKFADVMTKWFTEKGFLPGNVFKEWISTTGNINAELSKMDNMARDFRATVKKAYGLKIGQDLPVEAKVEINSALGGNKTSLASLPIEVQFAISEMRNHVDYLSQRMIDEGVVSGDLVAKFQENMGVYLFRSYRKNEGEPDWADEIDPQIKNRAQGYIAQQYPDLTTEEVDGIINELLYTPDAPMNLIKTGKLGSKDLSILKARKDIAPEIRALYGEYNDPLINYTKSVMKMINIIEKHKFLENTKTQGMDKFLFEKPKGLFKAKIAGDNSVTMAPLNGLYTTPEIAKAFEEFNKSSKIKDNIGFQIYMKTVSIFKANKTVYNISSHARNAIGGSLIAIANGHFDITNIGSSFATVHDHIFNLGNKDRREAYKESLRLGLANDVGASSELKANIEDAKLGNEGDYRGGPVRNLIRNIRGIIEGSYQGTDEAFKIYGYKNELARYKKAYPDMPQKELEQMATTIVRDTTPTYSLVPSVIKTMGNLPLIGTFTRFASENIRCTYNRGVLTSKELSSNNPEVRKIGGQRLLGQLLAYSAAATAAAISKYFYGISDEEEEDLRLGSAPWSKNSTFVYLGKIKDGKVDRIDLSQTDPFSYFYDPFIAILDGEKEPEENTWEAAKELLAPFFSLNAVAEMLADAKNNEKTTGGYIVNPSLGKWDKAQGYVIYALNNLRPGTLTSADKIYTGIKLQGQADKYGKIYNPNVESLAAVTGQRISSLDYGQALKFKSFEFRDRFTASKGIYTRDFKLKEQKWMSEQDKKEIQEERDMAIGKSTEALKRDIKEYRKLYFAGIRLNVANDVMAYNINLMPKDLRKFIKTEVPLDKMKMPHWDSKSQQYKDISVDAYLKNYLVK